MKNWMRFPLVLAFICTLSAIGVGSVYVWTKDDIAAQQKKKQSDALAAIFGEGVEQTALNTPKDALETVYEVTRDGARIGYMTIGVGQGYSSKLQVMVGVDVDLKQIKRLTVLYQNETPGLGTRTEEVKSEKSWGKILSGRKLPDETGKRPWFQEQFDGAAVGTGGIAPSSVDTISGATISSTAVITAVNTALARIVKVVGAIDKGTLGD